LHADPLSPRDPLFWPAMTTLLTFTSDGGQRFASRSGGCCLRSLALRFRPGMVVTFIWVGRALH
jgi:hypothetical protein